MARTVLATRLTGSPDESGTKRREKGLARAGNARVRCGMIQLAWRWLMFQESSELTQWYRARTAGAKPAMRKTMIVALARKLLIALWRLRDNWGGAQGSNTASSHSLNSHIALSTKDSNTQSQTS